MPDVGVSLHPPYTRPKKWYEKPFGIVALMIISGLIVGLIVAWCVYYFGWN
jgi:hypothetical protein